MHLPILGNLPIIGDFSVYLFNQFHGVEFLRFWDLNLRILGGKSYVYVVSTDFFFLLNDISALNYNDA